MSAITSENLIKTKTGPLSRMPYALRYRLIFLLLGNLFLLGYIYQYTLNHEGSSFQTVISKISPDMAPRLLAGIAMTGILYIGAIDLSVGAMIVMAGTVFGLCYEAGLNPIISFTACFLTPVVLSLLNSLLISKLKIPAIIITLAGLTFYRGVAQQITSHFGPNSGNQFSIQNEAFHTPAKEYSAWFLIGGILIALYLEFFRKTPRKWLAMGCSSHACTLKGINVNKIQHSAFFVSGIFMGMAALLFLTNLMTIEPSRVAQNFELSVIGAVVLGGTNIFGGEGSYIGTILGAMLLYLVSEAMIYAGVSEYWRVAIQGAVIISVIGFDCLMHRKKKLLEELK
jgi:ribose/xylose/arabinose/galactoside ABC-type transport system permease subunit